MLALSDYRQTVSLIIRRISARKNVVWVVVTFHLLSPNRNYVFVVMGATSRNVKRILVFIFEEYFFLINKKSFAP
jgi:hypothetical protein